MLLNKNHYLVVNSKNYTCINQKPLEAIKMVDDPRLKDRRGIEPPKPYYVGAAGQSIDPKLVLYTGVTNLILLQEDGLEQRANLVRKAKTQFNVVEDGFDLMEPIEDDLERKARIYTAQPSTSICVTSSNPSTLVELEKYRQNSPDAWLFAVLDYNMGENTVRGERTPSEGLFYNPSMQHFLGNGGMVIFHTGFPSQVKQSPEVMGLPQNYQRAGLLICQKGSGDSIDRVLELLNAATNNRGNVNALRRIGAAPQIGYDFDKAYDVLKKWAAAKR